MADFCLTSWNKMNGTNDDESKFVLSKESDFCEGYGEWKHVIVRERENTFFDRLCSLFGGWK